MKNNLEPILLLEFEPLDRYGEKYLNNLDFKIFDEYVSRNESGKVEYFPLTFNPKDYTNYLQIMNYYNLRLE